MDTDNIDLIAPRRMPTRSMLSRLLVRPPTVAWVDDCQQLVIHSLNYMRDKIKSLIHHFRLAPDTGRQVSLTPRPVHQFLPVIASLT